MATVLAARRPNNSNGWEDRHDAAVRQGAQIPKMLIAWKSIAGQHQHRFDSLISEDYILGPAWKQIGEGIRTLLNGELGQLDAGTLDGFICETIVENGFEPL